MDVIDEAHVRALLFRGDVDDELAVRVVVAPEVRRAREHDLRRHEMKKHAANAAEAVVDLVTHELAVRLLALRGRSGEDGVGEGDHVTLGNPLHGSHGPQERVARFIAQKRARLLPPEVAPLFDRRCAKREQLGPPTARLRKR